jgi:hypothetical protein
MAPGDQNPVFDDNPDSRWQREFAELGVSRVRGAMTAPGWDREKKQAARRWLDRQDKLAWQSRQKNAPPRGPSLKDRLRSSKWLLYVVGALIIFMMARRIF